MLPLAVLKARHHDIRAHRRIMIFTFTPGCLRWFPDASCTTWCSANRVHGAARAQRVFCDRNEPVRVSPAYPVSA